MTTTLYNTITAALGVALLIALVVALFSLVGMVARWKTPERRGHAVRLTFSIAALPCLIGIQQAILWLVFLPALGREQMEEINAARSRNLAERTLVQLGDSAPEFSLATIDGDSVTLPSPNKVVLINFFATWCGPCQLELPHIDEIWLDLKDDDRFQLLVIGREETPESVRKFCDEHPFSFPMTADPKREVYSLFAKESIPRTIVVSPEGQLFTRTLDSTKLILRN